MIPRLHLLVPVLGLALLAGPAPAPAAEPATAAPAVARAKPRLAAWRESARPPAEVPAAALVRAARRDKVGAAKKRRGGATAKPEPVEILWHAPGS